ncbi:MAG: cation diffusion facilitator family transporter [Candidatus Woesearchaeota archaeon]|nr:cation diffusion facilitator family transporter [Candidatus Woesearchaeota archaeon]
MNNEKITVLGIIFNSILFILKLIAGIASRSTAVISDAFNSLTDIISSIFIHIAVKIGNKKADLDHPFGHDRAEPVAAFISAVFAAVLGIELIRNAIESMYHQNDIKLGIFTVAVLVMTILIKAWMWLSLKEKKDSPALKAMSIDSRNDNFTSGVALIGLIGAYLGMNYIDSISALIISFFILGTAYRIGIENIDYLMGKSASDELMHKIRLMTLGINGIKGINDLRAHYVGNRVHVEIHVEVNKSITTKKSHDLGKIVQRKIESMPNVCRAFIHIDPV